METTVLDPEEARAVVLAARVAGRPAQRWVRVLLGAVAAVGLLGVATPAAAAGTAGGLSGSETGESASSILAAPLSAADLRTADLSAADLSAADLSAADLRTAGLRTADLSSGREITRYDATVTIDGSGVAHVAIDFDFDFGNDPGHGPYLTLPRWQAIDGNDKQVRTWDFWDITASSSTGAPSAVNQEESGDLLILRIGDPDIGDVSGVQTYQLDYTVDGWVNPANDQHDDDQFFFNAIGAGWEIPLSAVTITVVGPAPVQQVACYAGAYGMQASCTSATSDGDTATFTQDLMLVGNQLTIVAGWPAGTYNTTVQLMDTPKVLNPFEVTPLAVGLGLGVLVVGLGLVVVRIRKVGRDRAYLGLTPGLRPGLVGPNGTGFRDKRAPVAVQFTPPTGLAPGSLGTLIDETADPVDVTATLIDLAVRGYLRIEEAGERDRKGQAKDWQLVKLREPGDELLGFEAALMVDLFEKGSTVLMSSLRTTFAASMAKVQSLLYDDVTARGWFTANPSSVRSRWSGAGIGLGVLGVGGGFGLNALGMPGWVWVALPMVIVALVVLALAKAAPARSADGTAVLAEAMGFRLYLTTAEAEQIKFEEGQDIFSRYLPYAIAFGVADRWARVFAELAAQGQVSSAPGWYVGYYYPGVFWATSFAGSMDRFQSVATTSLSAPTPGSSGGSGFSGGFSGGGIGGGGGGGW